MKVRYRFPTLLQCHNPLNTCALGEHWKAVRRGRGKDVRVTSCQLDKQKQSVIDKMSSNYVSNYAFDSISLWKCWGFHHVELCQETSRKMFDRSFNFSWNALTFGTIESQALVLCVISSIYFSFPIDFMLFRDSPSLHLTSFSWKVPTRNGKGKANRRRENKNKWIVNFTRKIWCKEKEGRNSQVKTILLFATKHTKSLCSTLSGWVRKWSDVL